VTTGCFPVAIEGELLYGMLGRHRLLSGARTAADHSAELFGRRSAVASFDLPCRLDALAARIPAAAGLGGSELLSHTLFPFYAAFQSQETREVVERDLRASESSNAHHRLGVAAFRIRAGQALRFCPDCLDAQQEELGMATWLVAHQLPGVAVCALHGAWLRDSLVTRATAGRHGYVSPTEENCPRVAVSMVPRAAPEATSLLLDLARSAAALARSMPPARPLDHWRKHYADRLAAVGLMRSPRKVDQPTLNAGLQARWSPALPFLPAPCSSFGESGWVAAMVRTHRKAMHPLFHLLFDGFISHLEQNGMRPAIPDIVHVGGDRCRIARDVPAVDDAIPEAESRLRVDWAELNKQLCGEIRAAAADIRAAVPPLRVSRAEIERRVAKVDWFGKRRRKLPGAMRTLAEVEESVAAFRRRRAEHWIGRLGPRCRAWEVMRAAGLRSMHLPMVREAMEARQRPAS